MIHRMGTLVLMMIVGLCSTAVAERPDPDRVAVVNGESISIQEVEKAAEGAMKSIELRRTQFEIELERDRKVALDDALEGIVRDRLLAAEAKKHKVSVEELIALEVDSIVPQPADDVVVQFYNENKPRLEGSLADNASAIRDYLSSENVVYDRWYTQALRVSSDGSGKHHEFYWDLPNTSRVIRVDLPADYGNINPPNPALTWGDAPWSPSNEIMNGIMRGIQIYSTPLSVSDILSESNTPLSTAPGTSNIWYLNLNPTPSDISDKSGQGHNPQWVGSERPRLWSGQ